MSELIQVGYDDLLLRFKDEGDGKTLTGYIVPWNVPAWVSRPIAGWEVYKRGAFTRSMTEGKKPIPLLGLHSESTPIGRMEESHADDTGQHATFRLFESSMARDAAELVREGIWTGLSIGAWAVPARTKVRTNPQGERIVERSEVRLDHVALLRTPAFEDAKVLALRGADGGNLAAVVEARRRKRHRQLNT